MNNEELKHACKENWYKDTVVNYEKINKEEWSWVLEQNWIASEVEVDAGTADHVGEIISTHILLISYCPFCGAKLTDIRRNTW